MRDGYGSMVHWKSKRNTFGGFVLRDETKIGMHAGVMDVLSLSRLQFALTAGFHYLYPPLSIGLGVGLVVIEGLWLKTGRPIYHQMARFWTKVFALTFAIGVATGIVLEFEFGTNWATYSRYVGDVFGSALAAEGIFAFFLESGFLAVLLFGWDKVSRGMHFFATCMVCLGAHFSAVWIVVANSWQQTPAGYMIEQTALGPRAVITDFWAMVFNPSSMERLSHVVCGAWQAGAFLIISVSAFYLLRRKHEEFAKASMKVGLGAAVVASILQIVTGHQSALGVIRNQPVKMAAFEGHYETGELPIYAFGWVDEASETVRGLAVPRAVSRTMLGKAGSTAKGLREFPPEDRPRVNLTFQFYHLMVGVGMALMAVALAGSFLCWRGALSRSRWLLWIMVFSVLGPQIANQTGWFAAEMGRQPWVVYGLLRTSDGLSAVVKADAVLTSLILFTLVYLLLFAVFVHLLNEKIRHGPDPSDMKPGGKLASGGRADL
ncbi:MAG: Cytochrome bd-I ubiquinol oxidase subunit 1 [Verrucomicrobia bacterium ADurb.Bin006]|jgi:cytochrome d ubiquinol oxidase subunit I|nr:MAG: Cytochrome bd-I ubiquinol oxidase subunit 1 [Verrucomicrobia bacterium ADurb.Bin006]